MTKNFDLIVIGVGMAGLNIVRKCRSAGWEVAVVDSLPYGGTCMLRGCDPKKVLVGAAELVDWQRRMAGHGVTGDVRIDWADLMRFKRTFTDPAPANVEKSLQKMGVATYHGHARFSGQTTLRVGDEELMGKHIVVATGAVPRALGIPGAELVTTSTEFLELAALPERIVFVGGGYISFEFAHIAARAGAVVTILHRGERPLEGFDADLVEQLVAASRDIGIDIRLQTEVTAIERTDAGLIVHTAHDGERYEADMVVHGAGRVPAIEGLGLDSAGVEYGERGIVVNEYLQSISNPAVYAAGDATVINGMPLTPVAVTEGHVVASNLLKGNHRVPDYTGVPSVVFTIPALAKAGLGEDEARAQGLEFAVNHQDTSGWYSARRTNEKHTGFKVLIEEKTGRILGAHLLGAHAGEVINLFALAIRNGLTATDIKKTVFVHPAEAADISYMV
ncbi:MAG: NAD(P)/FAD-dependent oxidoreductase [Chloroflexi bacterium]|nr:MAG: NAD(P)/FAD-dependent oxidoreductase [Chloroflexota bacterium]